jgi:hypothetical protein
MNDKITNWYEKIGSKKTKVDDNFKQHMIEPKSMIVCIGPTGSGKTTALLELLNRKRNAFTELIIFTGSTSDEPIYQFIKQKIPETQLINNIADLPELTTFDDDDKDSEKLIVFDDFINLPKKDFKKINEYLTAGRKFGFSVFAQAQNYTSLPKIITRNAHYFILFRLNDNITIDNILKNHNISNISKEDFKHYYLKSTATKGDFFLIDLKNNNIRHNFKDILAKV